MSDDQKKKDEKKKSGGWLKYFVFMFLFGGLGGGGYIYKFKPELFQKAKNKAKEVLDNAKSKISKDGKKKPNLTKETKNETRPLYDMTIKTHDLKVELAHTDFTRHLGLMNRKDIKDNQGMLFVYPKEGKRSFWMKNTLIPLSVAFINKDMVIVKIAEMDTEIGTPDNELKSYDTENGKPAQYALEMKKGWFADHGVEVGDRLEGIFKILKNIPEGGIEK